LSYTRQKVSQPELVTLLLYTHLDAFYRAIKDFEALVSGEDYARLMNFPYLESREQVDKFTLFVRGLNIKKISGKFIPSPVSLVVV
jgi:hypothetical protein